MNSNNDLKKIGIFYDGNFFLHISNYFNFNSDIKSRINIEKLHKFIKNIISEKEGIDLNNLSIVESHFYRGRDSANNAEYNNKLKSDRILEEILFKNNIIPHYLPLTERGMEKGIDVLFALDCLELSYLKQLDYVFLFAGDGDYLPLLRKLHSNGTKTIILKFDLKFEVNPPSSSNGTGGEPPRQGFMREIKTSYPLAEFASIVVEGKTATGAPTLDIFDLERN